MNNFAGDTLFFGVVISLIGYEIGALLKRKLKLALFNPLLISIKNIAVSFTCSILTIPVTRASSINTSP